MNKLTSNNEWKCILTQVHNYTRCTGTAKIMVQIRTIRAEPFQSVHTHHLKSFGERIKKKKS